MNNLAVAGGEESFELSLPVTTPVESPPAIKALQQRAAQEIPPVPEALFARGRLRLNNPIVRCLSPLFRK